MANNINLPGDISKLAKDFLLAKSAFNHAYCLRWHTVQPCSDEMGWGMLDMFRGEVQDFVFKLNRGEVGIGQAAWEIFRKTLTGESDYSFNDAAGFVKWYEAIKNKIGRAIGHMYDYHGDSFGDLIDSYPLAGKALVERALASDPNSLRPRREGYLDEKEVTDAVRKMQGLPLHKLICGGENYVLHELEKACRKCYLQRILTSGDEGVTWTSEEENAVDFACHYDD